MPSDSGMYRCTTVPRPNSLYTVAAPPCSTTVPYTAASPSPVPCPTGFVVKKGSKIRGSTSFGMGGPLFVMTAAVLGLSDVWLDYRRLEASPDGDPAS